MSQRSQHYKGNPKLRNTNVQTEYTKEQIQEWKKCRDDYVYFIKNYVKIINVDEGLVNFELYDYQRDKILKTIHENRYSIGKLPRQCRKINNHCGLFPMADSVQTWSENRYSG